MSNRELSYMLFMHHYFSGIECLYRVWERFTHVFHYLLTGISEKTGYYSDMFCYISKSNQYSIEVVKNLKKHVKHWNNIAQKRNNFSHEYRKLIDGMTLEVEFSAIVDSSGMPFMKPRIKQANLKSILCDTKNKYMHLKKLDENFNYFLSEYILKNL